MSTSRIFCVFSINAKTCIPMLQSPPSSRLFNISGLQNVSQAFTDCDCKELCEELSDESRVGRVSARFHSRFMVRRHTPANTSAPTPRPCLRPLRIKSGTDLLWAPRLILTWIVLLSDVAHIVHTIITWCSQDRTRCYNRGTLTSILCDTTRGLIQWVFYVGGRFVLYVWSLRRLSPC